MGKIGHCLTAGFVGSLTNGCFQRDPCGIAGMNQHVIEIALIPFGVFDLLLLGFIPGYYLAMLIFTWGEIFSTVSEGPYVSSRIPASHRGRINGIMSVAYTVVGGAVDLFVGQLYDRAGSTWTWAVILGVTFASAAVAIILKARDKKAYPKLYIEEEAKPKAVF